MKRRKSTPFQIHRRDVIIPSLEKEGLNTVVYAHRRRATIALVTIGRVRMRVHIHSQTRGRMHKRREVNGTLENKRRIAHEFHTHSTTLIVLLHTYIAIVCTRARVSRGRPILSGQYFDCFLFLTPCRRVLCSPRPGKCIESIGVGGVAAKGRGGREIVAGEWQVRFYLWRCLLRVPLYWNVYRRPLVPLPLPVYFSIVLLFARSIEFPEICF